MNQELNKLSISTLNWLHHHGDSTLKSRIVVVLNARNKKQYQRTRQ